MFAVLSGRKSREGGRRPGRKQVYERKALIRLLIYIGTILLTAAAGYWFVCGFATKEAVMDDSIEPTLQSEDIVLVNKAAYKVGKPDSMDVALIRIGQSGSGPVYIRRIVGVPGDTVKITDGKLYVNDEQVELPGNGDAIEEAGAAGTGVELGDDEYFVLCDNYNGSTDDSRLDSIGTVSADQIIGKIWFRTSPASSIGGIH